MISVSDMTMGICMYSEIVTSKVNNSNTFKEERTREGLFRNGGTANTFQPGKN